MSAARILYRTRQFWQILRLAPSKHELDRVRSVLNPALLDLFFRMQPGEQSHSLQVYSKLVEAGESDPDLLTAALLHDAGKTRYPLNMWERAWIVIGKALLPRLSQEWSKGDIHGPKRTAYWKRSFIVAERHPDWGAELAAQAGASSRAVALIRRHQENQTWHLRMDPPVEGDELKLAQGEIRKLEDRLLEKLQAADDES
jgi:HD domain